MAIRFVEVGPAEAGPAGAPPEAPRPGAETRGEVADDGGDPPGPACREPTSPTATGRATVARGEAPAPPESVAPLLDPSLFPEVARGRRAEPKPRRNRRGFG